MKTRGWLVAAILTIGIGPRVVNGQCSNTIRTVTYDTVITGVGSSETPYTFTFPLFTASLGTLMDVNVSSVVSLNYNYVVENREDFVKTFRVKMTRYDDIVSPVLPGGALSYSRMFPNSLINPQNSVNYYSHTIAAADGVAGSGSDFADSSLNLLSNAAVISQSVPVTSFVGVGNTSFDYYTTMTNLTVNGNNTDFNTAASDQVTLSVTYTYCDNIMLGNQPGRVRPARETEEVKPHISPNPSHTGNFKIHFGSRTRGDWQVEVFTMNGYLVSRKLFYNALDAAVNNGKDLSRGVYIVRATNLKSHETFVERLIVK